MDYAERLLAWFDINKRKMPWRNTSDPYAIWVSEIMLQQTQVDTVIPYYIQFMDRFPTVHSLALAPLQEVLTYWQGLGYYRRAENLYKGAQLVEREYSGIFPIEHELVKKIPGIGPYTLGAILSIAFHVPIAAVDGNVMRILSRQFLIDEDISIAKSRKVFEEKVMALMPSDPNRFNQALMELGALVCTPKNPRCNQCPVSTLCRACQTGAIEKYPVKTPKKKGIPIAYAVLLIRNNNGYWMEKRPEGKLLAKLWGFPMVEKNETYIDIKGDLEEGALKPVVHVFTHRKWLMQPIVITYTGQAELKELMSRTEEGQFVSLKQMLEIPIATAFKKIIRELKKI